MAKYTEEQTQNLVAKYNENPCENTVNALAEQYDVPVKSIIAKLSSLGVYQRKRYLTKAGTIPVRKAELADKLGHQLALHDFEIEQLEKLSKPLLAKLLEQIKKPQ